MTVIVAHRTEQAALGNAKTASQERLENIFHAVDSIKADLNKCGLGITDKPSSLEIFRNSGFSCTYKLNEKPVKISYEYDPSCSTLFRVEKCRKKMLIDHVTNFYVTYFPDANSVLYRIELDYKEQVRGYVFLLNNTKD